MACWLGYHSHSLELQYSSIPLSAWITSFRSALYQARFWSRWQWCQLMCVYWPQQIYSKHTGCCRSGFGLLLPLNSLGLSSHNTAEVSMQRVMNPTNLTSSNRPASLKTQHAGDLGNSSCCSLNESKWNFYFRLNTACTGLKLSTSKDWAQPVPAAALPAVHPATNPSALGIEPKRANSKQTDVSSISPHFFPCGAYINAYWWLL